MLSTAGQQDVGSRVVPRPAPAYTRLDVGERRRRLLALGADLFTRHAYDELSMSAIAREAGISKALLYHYFPSKQAFFRATLEQAAGELAERVRPADDLPPVEQLTNGLDAFLGWIDENETAYRKLMQSVASVTEARELVDTVRRATADLILGELTEDSEPPPELRTAVRGWLWFMDGVCLEWLEHRDMERAQVVGLLLGTLLGAITASGHHEAVARVLPAT
jgi:AcrR family transcriptional regulator